MSEVEVLVERGHKAMDIIANYSQEQVDQMVSAISKVIYDNAEELANLAVEETGLGRVDHKIMKNENMAKNIYGFMKDKKSVGLLEETQDLQVIAHPVGLIGSVTPTTNPIITPMGNSMMALKGKNAIIISPHPRSKKSSKKTVELMRESLHKIGAPMDLIQIIEESSIEASQQLMSSVDVVVATGGPGLVKAAYSSGKPAFGVGPGNVQGILDEDFDLKVASELTMIGRSFDNGIVCACQQSLIYPKEKEKDLFKDLEGFGTYIFSSKDEVDKIRSLLFPNGITNPEVVGQSAHTIAAMAGIEVPIDTSVLAVVVSESGSNELLNKEKMCPVLTLQSYGEFEEAIQDANNNLEVEGKGHSVVVFSHNESHIQLAGESLPVSRVVINQPSIDAGGGANSLNPTTSLGCGSWGNNSISENLTYEHLINKLRIAKPKEVIDTGLPW